MERLSIRCSEAELCAPFLIVGAPDGVRPFRMMAGAAPVPLTAIAEQDVHTQHPLDAYFSPVQPAWP